MKKIILAFIFCVGIHFVFAQVPKKTYISATIEGYTGTVIDFEFMGKEELNMQYAYVANKPMEFEVELADIVLLKLNAFIWIYLQPGDKINVAVQYEGKNYRTAKYTGTPEAVVVNSVSHDIRNVRIQNRYKLNPMAAAVVQTTSHDYYEATLKEWDIEKKMIEAKKDQIAPRVYNYLYAEMEGIFLTNLVTYPYVWSNGTKRKIEDCVPASFWTVLDDYKLRDDEASLKSRAYMNFLLDYKNYVRNRDAFKNKMDYTPSATIEQEFEDIATFYEGSLRENALFVFLYVQITSGKNFDMAQKLTKQYLKKYSKNKEFGKILTNMMK